MAATMWKSLISTINLWILLVFLFDGMLDRLRNRMGGGMNGGQDSGQDGGQDAGQDGGVQLNRWEDYFGRIPAWFPGSRL